MQTWEKEVFLARVKSKWLILSLSFLCGKKIGVYFEICRIKTTFACLKWATLYAVA